MVFYVVCEIVFVVSFALLLTVPTLLMIIIINIIINNIIITLGLVWGNISPPHCLISVSPSP